MTDRYYNKVTRTEALPGLHPIDPPDVVVLPPGNPFWSPLPAGMQLTYDGANLPNGYEPIPPPVYTVEEQAKIDLQAAGVNIQSVTAAQYADGRGNPAPLTAIDAAVDAVVISSGLTLAQVSELV